MKNLFKIFSKEEKKLFINGIIYIKDYKWFILLYYFISILSRLSELIPVLLTGKIINYVVEKNFTQILITILYQFLCLIIMLILSSLETYLNNYLFNTISRQLKEKQIQYYTELSFNEYRYIEKGLLINLLTSDYDIVLHFYLDKLVNLVNSFITIIFSIICLIHYSFLLFIIAIISFPVTYMGYVIRGNKTKKYIEKSQLVHDSFFSFLNEISNSIKEIKINGIEKRIENKSALFFSEFFKINMKIAIIGLITGMFTLIISSFSEWLVMAIGCWLIINNKFTIGAYIAFIGYLGRLFSSLKEILEAAVIFKTTSASLKRISTVHQLERENYNEGEYINISEGKINIDNLYFSYEKNTNYILKGFSLQVKANTLTVLVGENRCGKTTIFSLIERLYKVAENKIFIDNNDINKISIKCLREQIAYIQQDTIIFDDTVRNNITLNIQTNESVFEKVCEKVRLDKIVNDLPMKYDTMIDKLSLSGGEKHKIAIARAILKNAKIILCDEITSDLDGIAEKEIINIFKNISNNCTVIFIAHRITSILGMQNICIIKDGKIVDCGNSDDLLLRNNYFRDLLNMQPQ